MGQIEYKTKWAAPLEDLPAYFQRKAHKIVRERQSIDAVFQLYGYMTFNENKYGILNNMEHAWFFQRVGTAESQGKTLQYYGPINFRFIRQVCSKPLWAPFCLPKLHLPGFIVPQPLLKYPPADTSVHLLIAMTQPLRRQIRALRSSWPDRIRFCHLTLVFAISTALPCVMLRRDDALH